MSIKIAVTGPESTGKSTLAQALASFFHTQWVPEFARAYLNALDRPYKREDIAVIARGQIAQEDFMASKAQQLLFCDTELLVCKIWSEFKYGDCDPWLLEQFALRHYDLFILCDIDLPWEDDPLREHPEPAARQRLFDLYQQQLTAFQKPFILVSGTPEARIQQVAKTIFDRFGLR